jgi:serine/threonine-protein kinase
MFRDAIADAAALQSPRSLPTDLVQRAARNVRIASLVILSFWLLGFFINEIVFPLWFREPGAAFPFPLWQGRIIGLAGVSLSLGLFLLARAVDERRLLDLGLAFQVATCALLGLLSFWKPEGVMLHGSWIAIIVLVYPSIAPNTLRKTLLAGIASASMSPLGIALAAVRGAEIPFVPFQLLWFFLPSYVAAVLAVLPAAIIRRLGRQVQSARELGSYRLGALIGSGGMGEVYHATHRLLARPAAIKLIRPAALEGRSTDRQRRALERFRREATAAAMLRSPHTIELYDFGISEDGVLYYVMELLEGVDLDRLVERFGPVPPERAIHLLVQACDSLAEAHAQGLMHRDIKPSNIQTCRMGMIVDFVKLLDFGLVKAQPGHPTTEIALTVPGGLAPGTPAFMAPESILNTTVPDHRADLYALGCVGYWLLTGSLVFDGATPARILTQHLEAEPVPVSRRSDAAIPRELDEILLACLAKQPEDRPASAAELAARLAACPVTEPWTAARARGWWDQHLPNGGRVPTTSESRGFHVDFTVGA